MGCGVAAVVAAVLVIAGSKYMVVSLLVDKAFEETDTSNELRVTAESMIVGIADGVVGEFETAGKRLAWPPGMSVEPAESQSDYPPDVWRRLRNAGANSAPTNSNARPPSVKRLCSN